MKEYGNTGQWDTLQDKRNVPAYPTHPFYKIPKTIHFCSYIITLSLIFLKNMSVYFLFFLYLEKTSFKFSKLHLILTNCIFVTSCRTNINSIFSYFTTSSIHYLFSERSILHFPPYTKFEG